MKAGQLTNRIDILQPSTTKDAYNQPRSDGWTPFAQNVPARVKDLQGRELYNAKAFVDQATHIVVMRYLPGVKSKMRVSFAGRIFEVEAVLQPDGKLIEHNLICIERSNAGDS